MTSEIIRQQPMASDFETEWISIFLDPISNFGNKAIASSLQIIWDSAAGTLNGTIELQATDDLNNSTIGMTIVISTNSNSTDAELLLLNPAFKFIKIKYTANGITAGKLDAVMFYE